MDRVRGELKDLKNKISDLESQLEYCCSNQNENKRKQANLLGISGNETENLASLSQNAPNPWNQVTRINFFIPDQVNSSKLYVFNLQGELIKGIDIEPRGESSIEISANELSPGMYVYSLINDGIEIDTKRMILTD